MPITSEGLSDWNYDHDPFTEHFTDNVLRVTFYGDDGVGSGPTMEFFTLATNGLNRRDLQLWIDGETHIDSDCLNATKSKDKSTDNMVGINDNHDNGETDTLWAFGMYRCTDCTLIDGIVCCPQHPDSPLVSYQSKSSNIGLQSCVEELFCCGEAGCHYHCHSDHNFNPHSCSFCGNRCDIHFVVLSLKSMGRLEQSFPSDIHCISHPMMQCDCCKMITFPTGIDGELLHYCYGGIYDEEGRSYPVHYLSSSACFDQHCHPHCFRSDINIVPILLQKSFVNDLVQRMVIKQTLKCLDLSLYQDIISLSSSKSRKMRVSGTKTYLNGDDAAKYKSKDSAVTFLCAQIADDDADGEDDDESLSESKDDEKSEPNAPKQFVIRNTMSQVSGINGLFYRPNLLEFIRSSPLTANNLKYLDVLGKIMVLAVAEGKRVNLDLNRLLFRVLVCGDNEKSDVSILDLLRMYPNDHYLSLFFRLFNIYRFLGNINLYSSVLQNDRNKMDVEEAEAEEDGDGGVGGEMDRDDDRCSNAKSNRYSRSAVIRLKAKCRSFVDVMGLTMNTPTFNVPLSVTSQSKSEEEEEVLTIELLEPYLVSICTLFLNDGVHSSNRVVQRGLESILQRDCQFLPFTDYEMEAMVTGSSAGHFDEWTPKYLKKFVKLEEFTADSAVIRKLFEILCHFEVKKKRQFIRFLTGSLSLPIGGLSKLRPVFTITKFTSPPNSDGEYTSLPHATTCRHTLRLPPYKTKKTLKRKLVQAMTQCQQGFYLS